MNFLLACIAMEFVEMCLHGVLERFTGRTEAWIMHSTQFGVNFRGIRFHLPFFSPYLAYQIRDFQYAVSLVSSIHWKFITGVFTFYQNDRQFFANQMSNSCSCLSATLFFLHITIIYTPYHT